MPPASNRCIQHGSNSERGQIGLGKLPGPDVRMSVMGSNRVLFMCDSLKVGWVVLGGQSGAGFVLVRGLLIEVEQFQRSPLFVEYPNARPFHSEHPASRFGDHPQRLFEISRIDRIVLCQLAQSNLLLFQHARPLSFDAFDMRAFGNIFRNA